jgi:hypothetical protein
MKKEKARPCSGGSGNSFVSLKEVALWKAF